MRPPLLFVAFSAVLLAGCYSAGDGQTPPLNNLYFPTGLALDVIPVTSDDPSKAPMEPAAPNHLYVASSDFDLQYNASALASFDLKALQLLLPRSCNSDADCMDGRTCDASSAQPSYFCVGSDGDPCESRGVRQPADQLLYPGRCQSIDSRGSGIIGDSVEIGAFATDIVFKATGAGGDEQLPGRLFLPVRGDATLHWIDVDSNPQLNLHCGQERGGSNRCDDGHRIGDDPNQESDNQLRQVPEPFAMAIDEAGDNIVVTNQTTGSVSLYANHWEPGAAPKLVDVLSGLPTAPVGIVAVPAPEPPDPSYQSGFLAVYRNAARVDLLRVRNGEQLDPNPSQSPNKYDPRVLTFAGSEPINANSLGFDSRGIVIDDAARQADYRVCRQPCAAAYSSQDAERIAACEQSLDPECFQAVHQPSVFVSNRAPSSLLVGALLPDDQHASGTSELPAFTDSIPLPAGPSRVVLGRVKVPGNTELDELDRPFAFEQRVFVVCFDSRRIYIYDPARRVIDSIVTTGRGPFALAIDEQRGFGYIAHFTDSYLGVISLDQRFPKNYAAIVASVGVPSPPRASK